MIVQGWEFNSYWEPLSDQLMIPVAFERVGLAELTISQEGGGKAQGRGQSWATESPEFWCKSVLF